MAWRSDHRRATGCCTRQRVLVATAPYATGIAASLPTTPSDLEDPRLRGITTTCRTDHHQHARHRSPTRDSFSLFFFVPLPRRIIYNLEYFLNFVVSREDYFLPLRLYVCVCVCVCSLYRWFIQVRFVGRSLALSFLRFFVLCFSPVHLDNIAKWEVEEGTGTTRKVDATQVTPTELDS